MTWTTFWQAFEWVAASSPVLAMWFALIFGERSGEPSAIDDSDEPGWWTT